MISGAEIFIFGSLLSDRETVNDIDVLVVYASTEGLSAIKCFLNQLGLRVPLDVTYMSAEEERGFQFVKQQGAIAVEVLWPAALQQT